MTNGAWFETEICVYGDSPGAVASAVQSARLGKKTILAVPGHHVGGILANGLGSNDLDNHSFVNSVAVGGIAKEYYGRVAAKYGGGNGYRSEPHISEEVFEEMLADAGVRILYGRRLSEQPHAVEVVERRIRSIRFENDDVIVAKVFVDGTVEGDLMAFAGVTYTWGRESNATYGETLNGVVVNSNYRQFSVSVDPYVVPGDPSSGVIPGIQDEPLGANGEGDQSIMGFCFRMVLTKNSLNRITIQQPAGYDENDYEIYLRYFAAGGASSFFSPTSKVPNGKSDVGSWHDLSANLYGLNHGWPDGDYAERQAIYDLHRRFTLGLIWFLQNDPRVPTVVRDKWAGWGLPADEFQDNGHWPRTLYIRSGRRMVSDYVITQADLTTGSPVAADSIGVAFWPPDMHHARRIIRDGKAWNEGFVFGQGISWRPFGISYRAIVPKASECENLLVPVALSSSYVGYGAVRLEWTFMVLGQSAGTAAALAVDSGSAVQDVDYEKLRPALLAGQQILELTQVMEPESSIIIDNRDASVELTGDWISSTHFAGHIGVDYYHDGNTGKGEKSLRFRNPAPEPGEYVLYGFWNADSARANAVPFTIDHAAGSTEVVVDQTTNSNTWVMLGSFTFAGEASEGVTISNAGTSGFVIADAIALAPLGVNLPELSITAINSKIHEGGSSARVIVSADQPVYESIEVPLNYSGAAIPGVDTSALPQSVILEAGKQVVSFEVAALPDELIEGEKALSITIAPSPEAYQIGAMASTELRFLDSLGDQWRYENLESQGLNQPEQLEWDADPDYDGLTNQTERELGTNPASGASALGELASIQKEDGTFSDWSLTIRKRAISTEDLPSPLVSSDLVQWYLARNFPGLVATEENADEIRFDFLGVTQLFVRFEVVQE